MTAESLRILAKQQIEEASQPGWPWGGSGNWSGCVDGLLGGETGEYCAALHPAKVLVILDALESIARGGCEENSCCRWYRDPDQADWCTACIARHALDTLNPSALESPPPGSEVITHPGPSRHGDLAGPGCAPNVP